MKVIQVIHEKRVEKTKKEMEEESKGWKDVLFSGNYKYVPLKKPLYIVELSIEELQLISFYLELEKRKPIMNVEL